MLSNFPIEMCGFRRYELCQLQIQTCFCNSQRGLQSRWVEYAAVTGSTWHDAGGELFPLIIQREPSSDLAQGESVYPYSHRSLVQVTPPPQGSSAGSNFTSRHSYVQRISLIIDILLFGVYILCYVLYVGMCTGISYLCANAYHVQPVSCELH